MKSVNSFSKGIVFVAIALFASATWADSKGTLDLQRPTNVAGTMLQTGKYTVTWQSTGDQIELKIYKGKNLITSVPATVIQLSSIPENDNAVINQGSDGSRSLAQIRFGGKKTALQIGNQAGGSGSSGSSK